jgi:hypothetical protein
MHFKLLVCNPCREAHPRNSLDVSFSVLLFLFKLLNINYTISFAAPLLKQARDTKLGDVSAVKLVEFVCSQASTMHDYQFWKSFVSPEIIFNATSSGTVEILRICFSFFPDLAWTHIPNEGYLVQIAIKYRQKNVLRFLCKMSIIWKLLVLAVDESNNTTSHLAARVSPKVESVTGEAFQLIYELQWLKVCLL